VALDEARAQVVEAEARARLAARQAETTARLRSRNAASEEDLARDRAEAEARRATVQALVLAAGRLEHDRAVLESERKTRLARLDREAAELEGEAVTLEATVRRLEHEIEQRTLRAPVAGRLGEVVELRPGSVVRPADRIGAVVPAGETRAVALFPAAAVGRIHPGQPARLRLEGFPWTQYGTIPATVAEVGNEPSGGLIRVEFTLTPGAAPAVPLEHGQPATAEVAVERVTPAVLVLRAAGQLLQTRSAAGPGLTERTPP
jgi:membrane fusion protein (multidrug efflux system)